MLSPFAFGMNFLREISDYSGYFFRENLDRSYSSALPCLATKMLKSLGEQTQYVHPDLQLNDIYEDVSSNKSKNKNKELGITDSTDELRMRKLTRDWNKEIKSGEIDCKIQRKKGDSAKDFHPGYELLEYPHTEFVTGSSYEGKCNAVGFAGFGTYTFPNDAIYEGYFRDGQFHGEGTITYPHGQQVDGKWNNGKLVHYRMRFADGLEFTSPWKYCQLPDRRFQTENRNGLKPAGMEQLTNQVPTKPLPPNCYDTIDGYFSPQAECVFRDDGEILRMVTANEEMHMKSHYRKAEDTHVGYRPDLYEYWTVGKSVDIRKITTLEEARSLAAEGSDSSDNGFAVNSKVTLQGGGGIKSIL